MTGKARFYELSPSVSGGDSILTCRLCPNNCRIIDGRTGRCKARIRKGAHLEIPLYGRISSFGIDPVEKKPLYHFMPGTETFSIGFFGCSLSCPFCQNHRISTSYGERDVEASPVILADELVDKAIAAGMKSLAFTYSEPTIHIEYLLEAATIARKQGLKTILVTNGYLQADPSNEILELIDAVNVDLKAHDDELYRRELGGAIEPVRTFITRSVEKGVHTEVTTLIIPGKNDDIEGIRSSARFLSTLDPDIPWHLSAYYPSFLYKTPATPTLSIDKAVAVGREYLHFVYPGNTRADGNTRCPECGSTVIRRQGYTTTVLLDDAGNCPSCGRRIAKIF